MTFLLTLLVLLSSHSSLLSTAQEPETLGAVGDDDHYISDEIGLIADPTPTDSTARIHEYVFVDTGHFLSSSTVSKTQHRFPHYGFPDAILHGSHYNSTGYNELSLKTMPFFEHGTNAPPVDVMVYVRPDVSTFYREAPGMRKAVAADYYQGQGVKFINMSPQNMQLYWDPGNGLPGFKSFHIDAFEVASMITYPGHEFYSTLYDDPDHLLCYFYIEEGVSLYVYDPFTTDYSIYINDTSQEDHSLESMDADYLELYNAHVLNLKFAEQYKTFSNGATWLSMYPKERPRHKIWRADYFGQQHYVVTTATHFLELPPKEYLQWVGNWTSNKSLMPDASRPLQAYRSSNPLTNLTLTSLSCAPRVFEVENFLSEVEVDHILQVAQQKKLKVSTTGGMAPKMGGSTLETHEIKDRSSTNTWLHRETSPIIDTVYRRLADLLRVDESLLRDRGKNEHDELDTKLSIASTMQIVHYGVKDSYYTHFDFAHRKYQPTRYANLVMYLNDDVTGGEIHFPNVINAETERGLTLKPKKGNAILYYTVLPDGNMDELSKNGILEVKEGESWLANIFVWDPYYL